MYENLIDAGESISKRFVKFVTLCSPVTWLLERKRERTLQSWIGMEKFSRRRDLEVVSCVGTIYLRSYTSSD